MTFIDKMQRWGLPYDPDLPTDLDELYEMLHQRCAEVAEANRRRYEYLIESGYSDSELTGRAKERERRAKPDPYLVKINNQINGVKIAAGLKCRGCYADMIHCGCSKDGAPRYCCKCFELYAQCSCEGGPFLPNGERVVIEGCRACQANPCECK